MSEAELNVVARAVWACSSLPLAQVRELLRGLD
jgi:hypothetical protein